MSETNWYPIQLPSLGRYYEKCSDGKVEITPWTTAQEEMIVRHAEESSGENLTDKLIKSNVRFPEGFDHDHLLGTDQHYLLMKLRAVSITCMYTIDHDCPECKAKSEKTFDIEKLPITTPEDTSDWDEPFEVKLPRCGATIGFRHFRMKDQTALKEYRKKSKGSIVAYRYAKKITSINGREDLKFDEKRDFVAGLIMLDLEVLRDAADRKEFGIQTEVKVECPGCKYVDVMDLPLQMSFFRPKRADIEAAIAMAG